MPKIICVKDEVEYQIEKSGGYVIEYVGNPPQPYKVWSADGWRCPVCGNTVMAGFGNGPLGEHYEESFQDLLQKVLVSPTSQAGWVVKDYEKKRPEFIDP